MKKIHGMLYIAYVKLKLEIDKWKKIYQKNSNWFLSVLFIVFIALYTLKILFFIHYMTGQTMSQVYKARLFVTVAFFVIFYIIMLKYFSRKIFISFYFLQTVYFIANLLYFQYFYNYLHFWTIFQLFSEGMDAIGTVKVYVVYKSIFLLFIDIFAVCLIFIYYSDIKIKLKRLKITYLFIVPFLVVILLVEFNNYEKGYSLINYLSLSLNDNKKGTYYGERKIVLRYGTLTNIFIDFVKFHSEKEIIKLFKKGKKISSPSKNQKHNIVVIQVESMESNVASYLYKKEPVMPFLYSLKKQSVYYPFVLSTHGGGHTSDAEFSIINSMYSLVNFAPFKLRSYNFPNSEAKLFKKNGYSAVAFHANRKDTFNRGYSFDKMGFDCFYDLILMNLEVVVWGAPDSAMYPFVLKKMNEEKNPFYYYVITMSSHGPFKTIRLEYNNERYNDIEDEIVRDYFNAMNYVDVETEKFVKELMRIKPDSYIFIIGDHAPGNFTYKEYKPSTLIYKNEYFEFVPLYILTPDNKNYVEEKYVASFIDIAPTNLEASGIGYEYNSDGNNLLKGITDNNIYHKDILYKRDKLYELIKNY